MIHLIAFVRAKQGMSREDFRRHWAEVHGPLVAGIPEERRHTAYYAQYPRLDSDYERPNSPDFDGIAIQSFESMDEFKAFLAAPEVAEQLGPDGPKFMDQQASVFIMTDSPMVFIGQDPQKPEA
jgi:uncharacterized protein (TIGR02118 family)